MTDNTFCFKKSDKEVIGKANSIKELLNLLKEANPSDITYHLRGNNNDFANWIRAALNDKELATTLEIVKKNSKTIEDTYTRICNILDMKINGFRESSGDRSTNRRPVNRNNDRGAPRGQRTFNRDSNRQGRPNNRRDNFNRDGPQKRGRFNDRRDSSRGNRFSRDNRDNRQRQTRSSPPEPVVVDEKFLLIKQDEIVLPGSIIANGGNYRSGFGTFINGENIVSKFMGKVSINNGRIFVDAFSKKYLPKKGDLVIGVISDIGFKKWDVNINSVFNAKLLVSNASRDFIEDDEFESYFSIGDAVVAKVSDIEKKLFSFVSLTEPHTHRLTTGRIIEVNAGAVGKIIGTGGENIRKLVEETQCKITVAQNGRVWIDGTPDQFNNAVDKIREIEQKLL